MVNTLNLLVNGTFVSNIFKKANIFIDFFCQKCQPILNDSILQLILPYYTENRLNEFQL